VEEAVGVDAAEIAGAEPAVGREGGGRRRGIVPIARKHAVAAREDLAGRVAGVVRDSNLYARQRSAFGAEPRTAWAVERQHGRRFREAVAGEHAKPEAFELPRELARELRAAAADERERSAETRVDRAEQRAADPKPRVPAHGGARGKQCVEDARGARAARANAGLHAVPDGRAETRYGEQRRRPSAAAGFEDLGAGDAGRQHHGAAARERHEQPDRVRIRVMQR
jgi:hypothetical protein